MDIENRRYALTSLFEIIERHRDRVEVAMLAPVARGAHQPFAVSRVLVTGGAGFVGRSVEPTPC